MTDPSIGSSSPNWATLVSNEFSRTYTKSATPAPPPAAPAPAPPVAHIYCTPSLHPNILHGPSPTGVPQGMVQDSPQSPYALVFYPMGSYAAHLLSLEQAAQNNPQAYPPPPPRFMDGVSADDLFLRNSGMEPAWSVRLTPSQRNLQQGQQGQRQPTDLQQVTPIGACLSQAAVAPMPSVIEEALPGSALSPAWSTLEQQQQEQHYQDQHQQQQQQLHHEEQQQLTESAAAQVQTQPSLPHQPSIREDWRGYEQLIAAVAPQPHGQSNLTEQQQEQLVVHPPPTPTPTTTATPSPSPTNPTPAPAALEPCSIPSQPVPHSISMVYDYWREIEEMISAFIAETPSDQATDQSHAWRHMNLPQTDPTPDVDRLPAEFSELWNDLEENNTQPQECSKPAEPNPEQKPQAEQQHVEPPTPPAPPSPPPVLPTTHREREWWVDAEQKVATAVVAPQPQVSALPEPVCDWWVSIENKTANVLLAKEKEKGQLQQQKQQKHPPSSLESEQLQQPTATSPAPREWWQAAAFTPQQQSVQSVQSVQPVQTVQPLQQSQGSRRRSEPAGEWRPYSYADMLPADCRPALSKAKEEKHYEPSRVESSTAGCSRSPTMATGATTSSATSVPSAPSAQAEFPSFEDFARQVTECSLSSSEYIATLRNLMIRAHNLLLPLLRGRFANMTQVQMAAYTTAILEITPLHPSLFLPSVSSLSPCISASSSTPRFPLLFTSTCRRLGFPAKASCRRVTHTA